MNCTPTGLTANFICGTGVELNLSADITGTWVARYRFTRLWLEVAFAATAGQNIVLPDGKFMEGTTYFIQLERPDGTVLNSQTYFFDGQTHCNTPAVGSGLTVAQVNALIAAAIAPLIARIKALEDGNPPHTSRLLFNGKVTLFNGAPLHPN